MPLIGETAALITAALWAVSALVFDGATQRIGSQLTNISRLTLSAILLLITIVIARWFAPIPLTDIMLLVISGWIGLLFGDGFLFKAFQLIGVRISMLIMSLVPAISAIMAFIFLKENLTITVIIGMIITLSGIMFVVGEGKAEEKHKLTFFGIFCATMGAVGQAAGMLFAKAAFSHTEINSFVASFIRLISSVLLYLPFMLIAKSYMSPVKLFKTDSKSFYLALAGAILGPYCGMTLSLVAVKNTSVGIASTLMATTPVIMLPILHYYKKEKISVRGIIGAIVAVTGVAILFLQ
jgi:drug/metabolite transporter (DMT)-like permease